MRRAKLFVFLRTQRHTLFDAAFQEELATLYEDRPGGHPPVSPARLALMTILQAYTEASDAEAVEAAVMDRRWQLALDCLDCADAPLSMGRRRTWRDARTGRRRCAGGWRPIAASAWRTRTCGTGARAGPG